MRWTPGGQSEDVEDRRGEDSGGGGGGFGLPHIGIGGILILIILSLIFKRNFLTLLSNNGSGPGVTVNRPDPARDEREQPTVQFVSFVLDDAQKNWEQILSSQGIRYRHAKLVLFRNATYSGCGSARAATGPFYCPADEKIYIDLDFFDELKSRFGAPGQFAQAYVLAHELGHHVQKLIGVESRVRRLQEQNPSSGNALSVRMELQADCLAGVWSHTTEQRNLLESGDVESAMGAAAAVGDDRLQRETTGRVSPESFTHGTSAQRTEWFKRGLESGSVQACNTFQ